MILFGKTDKGQLRKHNEDAFIAQYIWNNTHLLCAAIDGIGGNCEGEIASEIVRDTIIRNLEDFPVWDVSDSLQQAVIYANNEVIRYQRAVYKCREMGCVMSAGIIDIKNRYLYYIHIGDTRIYTLESGKLSLLTQDESNGSMLFNYIGKRPVMPGESFGFVDEIKLKPKSTLLFCTDGLWKLLGKNEIINNLSLSLDTEEICNRLINKVNEKGGIDNITVVVVKL